MSLRVSEYPYYNFNKILNILIYISFICKTNHLQSKPFQNKSFAKQIIVCWLKNLKYTIMNKIHKYKFSNFFTLFYKYSHRVLTSFDSKILKES